MKVELVLNDDVELRAYIKELIKNEVINVSRQEIKDVTGNELNRVIKNSYNNTKIDNLIKQQVAKEIGYLVNRYWDRESDLDRYLTVKIDNILNTKLAELNTSITANIIKAIK